MTHSHYTVQGEISWRLTVDPSKSADTLYQLGRVQLFGPVRSSMIRNFNLKSFISIWNGPPIFIFRAVHPLQIGLLKLSKHFWIDPDLMSFQLRFSFKIRICRTDLFIQTSSDKVFEKNSVRPKMVTLQPNKMILVFQSFSIPNPWIQPNDLHLDYLETKGLGYKKTLEYLLSTKFSKIIYPFYQRKLPWGSQKHLHQIWNDAYCLFFSLVRLLYFIFMKRQIQQGMGSFKTWKPYDFQAWRYGPYHMAMDGGIIPQVWLWSIVYGP